MMGVDCDKQMNESQENIWKKVILKQTCQVDHDHQYDPNQTIQIQWMLEI